MATFSAALLAGGQSRRMGRDKALLSHPDGGLFWERQLALLEELCPQKVFWSGHARPGLPARVQVIADAVPAAGPLGGLAACLSAVQDDLLVVLAVDLVNVHADFLRRLLAASTAFRGSITRHDFIYEPLAAIYPRSLITMATAHLAQGRYALQDFAREAERAGMLQVLEINADEAQQLKNFNFPDDLPGGA